MLLAATIPCQKTINTRVWGQSWDYRAPLHLVVPVLGGIAKLTVSVSLISKRASN